MAGRETFRHTEALPRTPTFVDAHAGEKTAQLVPTVPAQNITVQAPDTAAPEDVFGRMAVRTVEHTSPMLAAQAFLVKYAGLTAILAVLSVGLVWWLQAPAPFALVLFAGLAIAGYWLLAWTEAVFTVAGVERHRLTQGAKVLRAQIDAEHDVRLAQVELQQSIVNSQREYNRQVAQRHRAQLQAHMQPETDTPAWVRRPGREDTARRVLLDFTVSLYERDDAGDMHRVDSAGYIARDTVIPFGKRGGLTQAQRQQVTAVLAELDARGVWLLRFDKQKRLWQLNVRRYPDAQAAVDAIDSVPALL
jgi:hypothetical protein